MAEQFFVKLSREAGLSCAASSAGTQAVEGMPLSRGAAAVLAARGIGPAAHRARLVDKALFDAADAVYALERSHRDLLVSLFPESAGKIAVLREAAGLSPADVEDPVGGDAARYEKCADAIEEALKIIVRREREPHAPNPR